MGPPLEIRTLGGLTIERNGQTITDFDSRKVQALPVYLACTGKMHPREVLAELFWEEPAQSASLTPISQCVFGHHSTS